MGQRILLVEDEPIIVLSQQRILERAGYSVTHAISGERALVLCCDSCPFDLILMDIDLGDGMDGTEAAKKLLDRYNVPLIFLSAHTEPEVVQKTEEITSYGYIVKDSGEAVLLGSIRMAFRLFYSQQLYQNTFDHSISGMCVHRMLYDDDGNPFDCRYITVNKAFEQHTGLSSSYLLEKDTIKAIYPQQDIAELLDIYATVVRTGEPYKGDYYFEPSGNWFDLSVFPMQGDLFTVVVQNVNREKEAVEQLKRSEANYRQLFQNHSAVKLIIDAESGRIRDANRAALEFYGWDYSTITSMNIQQINTLQPQQISSEMDRARLSKRNYFEFRHRCADGSVRDVNVFSNRVVLDGRDFLHSIIFDVTEHKQLENHYLQLFRSLTMNSPNLVAIFDQQGRSSMFRKKWLRFLTFRSMIYSVRCCRIWSLRKSADI